MMLILPLALLAGCAQPATNYCLISSPLLFEDEGVVAFLLEHDKALLQDVVVHNETYAKICRK